MRVVFVSHGLEGEGDVLEDADVELFEFGIKFLHEFTRLGLGAVEEGQDFRVEFAQHCELLRGPCDVFLPQKKLPNVFVPLDGVLQVDVADHLGDREQVHVGVLQLESADAEVGAVHLLELHLLEELHVEFEVQEFGQLVLDLVADRGKLFDDVVNPGH